MDKYPRTYHLPFSPEVHSDDKVCNLKDIEKIIDGNVEIVITEKLDGGNCCLQTSGVYARSHSQTTSCPTFNYIKNVHYYPNLDTITEENVKVFGENMFAIHSIEYDNLQDYFYIFNILEMDTNKYMSYSDVEDWGISNNLSVVPTIYEGTIKSLKWLEEFLADELKKSSGLGGEREGFVVRVRSSFHRDDFTKKVFKYVRAGHIQTSEHWSKNWVQAKLNKD